MHNKALRRVKLTANSIPAGDVILLQSVLLCPFFGLANFAGLFSFQLLTFVCRTPIICYISYAKICIKIFTVRNGGRRNAVFPFSANAQIF